MNWTNVKLIWHREIRDQLRDRRTIFTIAILPLVLYPMMGMTFLRVTQFLQEHPTQVCLLGASRLPASPPLLEGGQFAKSVCPPGEAQSLRLTIVRDERPARSDDAVHRFASEAIRDGRYDAVLYIPADFATRLDAFRSQLQDGSADPSASSQDLAQLVPTPQLLANLADDKSRIARDRTDRVVRRWREEVVRDILRSRHLPEAAIEPFSVKSIDVSDEPFRRAAVWSKVLPFVVLIWALTGAFYPAIDLCAGEKERGTLETLLCSPALRSEIVWGKLLTVTTFSVLTALLNLFSLAVTGILLFGRLASIGPSLEIGPPPIIAICWLLLALVPISALFSALALAIAAFARSSKEGQYYLMPLLLITLPLMILALLPAVELELGTSVIPVTGIMLWLRALIEGEYGAASRFAAPVLGVTAICAWMSIRWAERQFQNESVLFRESERMGIRVWMRHMVRDRGDTPSAAESLVCGVLILIVTFFGSLYIQPPSDWLGLARVTLATQLGLVAFPAAIMAVMLTRRPDRTLLLTKPPWLSVPLAMLLAVSLHPSVVLLARQIQAMYPPSEEVIRAMEPLSGALLQAPWWQVLLVIALAPAICEELAFRGFVLSGLRHLGSTTAAIVISSLFFGVTHGMLQQSLSAIALGIVLGFIAVRTGSLLPCIAFHFTHNGLSVMVSRLSADTGTHGGWLDWLLRRDVGQATDFHYSTPVVIASIIFAMLLLRWFQRLPFERSFEERLQDTADLDS
ncbi:MAG: ABC transporter permease subunit [Planctomycetes bacterium]|nr:ABC transporter permease subunit [Planctomycetota bacterium]